jgi:hypothetical protein
LTYGEIRQEAKLYGEYRKNFSLAQASQPTLSLVVVPKSENRSFSNLKRWYEFRESENIGEFTLYKVRLKQSNP